MTATDPVISALAEANPVGPGLPPDAGAAAAADEILRRVLSSPAQRAPNRARAVLVPVLSALVVIGVVVLFIRAGAGHGSRTPAAAPGLTIEAQPASPAAVTAAQMTREAKILTDRLNLLGADLRVTVQGRRILVTSPGPVSPAGRALLLTYVTERAQLYVYDWEADVLTANGKTAASQLAAQNPAALTVSQGPRGEAGYPGAGSSTLYAAVRLASNQPAMPASKHLSRIGPQYWMFGAPGSTACATAARDHALLLDKAQHCLLAGPVQGAPTRAQALRELTAQLPAGVRASQAQVLTVPQGTVVLQAAGQTQSPSSPGARFFVLRDDAALNAGEIVDPAPGVDSGGSPDVDFGLTHAGRAAFQGLTARLAHRGQAVSNVGAMYCQHFAVAVNGQLLTIPYVNYEQYPDGIIGNERVAVSGGLTTATARGLASELRYGALPFQLRVTTG